MSKKKRWTAEETRALLRFYNERRNEFKKARKRRSTFSRVLEDMLAAGLLDPKTTVAHLEVKMQTLMRAYKAAKLGGKAGGCPCLPPFMEEMEEVFGKDQIHLKTGPVNFGGENFFFKISEVSEPNDSGAPSCSFSLADVFPEASETSELIVPDPEEVTFKSEIMEETASCAASSSSSSSESTTPVKRPTKRITRSAYYARRLEQREREMKAIAERWKQHQQTKEEWRRKKLEMLEKILKK